MQPNTTIDLSELHADFTAQNGHTLTGTLAGNYKISVAADGATCGPVTIGEVAVVGVTPNYGSQTYVYPAPPPES